MKELYLEEQQAAYDDDSDYEYWQYLKSYVPAEPAERYRNSIDRLDEITGHSQHLNEYPMFHRMMLVQHVAILEAYLADRIITLVAQSPEKLRKIILGNPKLKDQKFTLEAMAGHPDLIGDKVSNYLKNLLYHELDLVSDVYKSALGVDIFTDETSANFLREVMVMRHHCVHRDGKDNDGKVLNEIDAVYVSRARNAFVAFMEHIERQCSPEVARLPH